MTMMHFPSATIAYSAIVTSASVARIMVTRSAAPERLFEIRLGWQSGPISSYRTFASFSIYLIPIHEMVVLFILRLPAYAAFADDQFAEFRRTLFYLEYNPIFFSAQRVASDVHRD